MLIKDYKIGSEYIVCHENNYVIRTIVVSQDTGDHVCGWDYRSGSYVIILKNSINESMMVVSNNQIDELYKLYKKYPSSYRVKIKKSISCLFLMHGYSIFNDETRLTDDSYKKMYEIKNLIYNEKYKIGSFIQYRNEKPVKILGKILASNSLLTILVCTDNIRINEFSKDIRIVE